MISRRILLASALAPFAGLDLCKASTDAVPSPSMVLGVQTHFSQGWHLPWMDIAKSVGASNLRDGLTWSTIETQPGVYNFDPYRVDFLDAARRKNVSMLLAIDPRHRAYDGGTTVHTPEGMTAYANYLAALLDRYGDVVSGIEVGNEINGRGGMNGPAAANPAASHVALLRTVYSRIKPAHPNTTILGGSTNVIGVGFLERIFAAGGLDVMDGVAVHPYRPAAELVDVELAALTAAMRRHGRVIPIFATEFSDQFETPELASPHLIKMVALMGASGVAQAYWYAVQEERWFPNMGLFTQRQARKPAGETFAFIEKNLVPLDRPTRVAGDPLAFVFQYGRGATVLWGAPRPVRLSGSGQAFDSRGRPVALPTRLSDDPIIVLDDVQVALGQPEWLADSFYGFGQAPWSYFAQGADGVRHPLDWIYWEWTSYIGDRRFRPLSFNPRGVAPAGDGNRPINAVLRYTALAAGPAIVRIELSHNGRTGDGVDIIVRHGEDVQRALTLSGESQTLTFDVNFDTSDFVELAIGPHLAPGGDTVSYRMTILDPRTPPQLA